MPKILIMKFILSIILLFPFLVLAQSIKFEHISENVNGYGSELNFVQIDENTAYYTSSTLEEEQYQSAIFSSQFKDGKWKKGKYINLGDSYSTANIHFPKNNPFFYFSICDENGNCKIAFRDYEKQKTEDLNSNINQVNSSNTQPHLTQHKQQNIMYFVSDRKGGFGGMDIWLSIIDKQGNFGLPINAGKMVNTSADEITPFFNQKENLLYFSSNKKGGLGGFDIYKVEGKLNLWEKPISAMQFNSKQDEMYLNFYDETNGYLASNRKGALYNTEEFCCNDIFSFELEKPEIEELENILLSAKYLPLKLYFHNDEPDCCTMSISTDKTYKDSYISYFKMEDDYNNYTPNLASFFEDSLQGNFNKLSIIFSHILSDLKEGKTIQLLIKGYASPLHKKQYNINLSKRRIKSFINYAEQYEGGIFTPYIKDDFFQIIELPFGESKATKKVSDDPNDRLKSIYSLAAVLERRIEIVDIKLVH
jgi:hypothetical protein